MAGTHQRAQAWWAGFSGLVVRSDCLYASVYRAEFQHTATHGAAAAVPPMASMDSSEWGADYCYRGRPSSPSGMPLGDLCCEPSVLPAFGTPAPQNPPSGGYTAWPGHGKPAPPQHPSSSHFERATGWCQDGSWGHVVPDAMTRTRRTRRRAPRALRSSSHSSVASQGSLISFGGASLCSVGEQQYDEGVDRCAGTRCLSAARRQQPAPHCPGHTTPAKYGVSAGGQVEKRLSPAGGEAPHYFNRDRHGDAMPRRCNCNLEFRATKCTLRANGS